MKIGKHEINALNVSTAASIGVGALAFSLSFTALTDLAEQNGIGSGQSWMLPLVVDGLVVVSTAASARLKRFAAAYAWMLLVIGTATSVWGNVIHAKTNGFGAIGMAIAAVPPLFLLAVSHLTILLAHQVKREAVEVVAVTEAPQVVEEAVTDAPAIEEVVEAVIEEPQVEEVPAAKTIFITPTNAPVVADDVQEVLHPVG